MRVRSPPRARGERRVATVDASVVAGVVLWSRSAAIIPDAPSLDPMADTVIQQVPLGPQWPTIDPFLFCAHHLDRYPAANARLGPAASLDGRQIGQDFAGIDGWNMYHGSIVPGFPQHPHRGFETVTFVRRGLIDHSDSMGATARFGRGDTQWLTAGRGIQHSEMFPLVDPDAPNPLQLFQIWVNLPASDKMVDPYFTMFWSEDTPEIVHRDGDHGEVRITVIAGALGDARPLDPPPNSWASRPEADLAIWHLSFDEGTSWEIPPAAGADTVRTLYVFEGEGLEVDGEQVSPDTGAVVRCTDPATLRAHAGPVEVLVLQGHPIGEPVARYGPFVMNTQAEIEQTFRDYQRTSFGGWPFASPAPDHGPTQGRFAIHADGTREDRTEVA